MAHLNRRSDDTQDGQRHRVLELVESTGAKVFARGVVPVLLAIIGFFLVRTLNQVADNQQRQDARNEEQARDMAQVKSDVRVITTRLDEGVVRQVNTNTQTIQAHEQRLQVLERTVKTP